MIHPSDGAAGPPQAFASHHIDSHPLAFIGSGGGYFRVWIVNLLLLCLTLGCYTPWARRRTAQYFYSHTLVAGSPLEFAGPLRKMVYGFVLMLQLYLTYHIASSTGQMAAVGGFLLVGVALAPFVWASAMRFRLNATRWRGLRWQFTANWREVYGASWPLLALALVWFGLYLGMEMLAPDLGKVLRTGNSELPLPSFTPAMNGLVLSALLLTQLCFVRIEYNYKRLLVLKARLGVECGRWTLTCMDFVKVWLVTVLLLVLGLVVFYVLLQLLLVISLHRLVDMTNPVHLLLLALIDGAVIFLLLALVTLPARAYRQARLFRLVWNSVGLSQVACCECRLSTGRYILLRIRNTLLMLLTLGFFRPFARVSEYRMKLESVTLHVKGGVEQVAGALVRQQQGSVGDALAADMAGLDLVG